MKIVQNDCGDFVADALAFHKCAFAERILVAARFVSALTEVGGYFTLIF